MKQDILGSLELESLKLNWDFLAPGMLAGKCNATGTCDNGPSRLEKRKPQIHTTSLSFENIRKARSIRRKYGSIHT